MAKAIKKTVTLPEKVTSLLKKGVRMTNPFSVEIGEEVNLERIDRSLKIYGAARICGENTVIADDVQLGYEGPVTVINCQLGCAVELKGGYFADSVFLEKAKMGGNAQVRSGCLLEEESSGNHCVGLKQTILFPFVTLGSLINFCDCLMAGGTSRKNHSEVGSSYIHFNYTPQQDKATASLIGDVAQGVMLKESPIFLGGQGGMVGPVKIDYGTLIPAGCICRQDTAGPGLILFFPQAPKIQKEYLPGSYGDISRKVYLNILYMANLLALKQWYIHVRRDFFLAQKFGADIYEGAVSLLDGALKERFRQMNKFSLQAESSAIMAAGKKKKHLSGSIIRSQKELLSKWPLMEKYLRSGHEAKIGLKKKEAFTKIIQSKLSGCNSYLSMIKGLTAAEAKIGSGWLSEIITATVEQCIKKAGSIKTR
jgi:UDP-N-acetylglucosamine/UDP-N-acetylgalactosamine diphosphorylase